MTKVCIIYGWAEGELIGARLRKTLGAAGFDITHSAKNADALIVHEH